MKPFWTLAWLLWTLTGFAQQTFQVEKMTCQIQLLNDSIDIRLAAPTQGWLAIGFNEQNQIVGADLLQLRVRAGQLEGEDQFVVAAGKNPTDSSLGGKEDLRIVAGQENAHETRFHLRIPFQSRDRYDFKHQLGEKCWLILAYSLHDDFGHHSTMRQHRMLQLE